MADEYKKILELLDADGPRLHTLLTRLTRREDVVGDLMQELVIRLHRPQGLETARAMCVRSRTRRKEAASSAWSWRICPARPG